MKRILGAIVMAAMLVAAGTALASPSFPEKGWHKGPYLTANVGMMQVSNDSHSITDRKFNGTFDPAFGLTFGWDIADWIGPQLQINFATTTSQVGDANGGNNGGAAYSKLPGVTFPAGTFPVQNGVRQYAIDLGLYCRATLPYFLYADWQGANLKFIPYAKLGGIGNAVYNNASSANNKAGAYGGGIGIGVGGELFIWKGVFVGIEAIEGIIFQKAHYKNITTNAGVQNLKLVEGGTKFQFNLQGLFGWHF